MSAVRAPNSALPEDPLAALLACEDPREGLSLWLEHFADGPRPKDAAAFYASLMSAISGLDERINRQLNAIIHAPRLQALEASWRGLWYVVSQAVDAPNCKIKLLDITWAEICRDLSRALDFDQSQLFHKIYSDEFGAPGGEPFGAILGDYALDHHPDNCAALERLSQVCASAFAPFVAGAAPSLLGLDQYDDLRGPLRLEQLFSQQAYAAWRAMRARPDARFVGLTLPRIRLRPPYRATPGNYRGIYFHESAARGADHCLWGNACFAFGGILLREFAQVGWFGHIRGAPRDVIGGGLVANLPALPFETDAAEVGRPVVDWVVTDERERELSQHGLIALCQSYGAPFAVFYSNPSVHACPSLRDQQVMLNARLASMLQHVLCGSRIAHYIKVMIRDKVGSFMSAAECEKLVREWLFRYTTGRTDLDWEAQARYPLREARVAVREQVGKPGCYACVIHLVPHYQADQMVAELELVTEVSVAERAA